MKSLDNVKFDLKHIDSKTNIRATIEGSVVGHLCFTYKNDGFSNWNKHYELECDELNSESIHIIGISVNIDNRKSGTGRKLVEFVE